MISKKLLKSSFIYTVIGSLPLASGLILLPIITNEISPDSYGILALYISFSLLIQVIVNFSIDTSMAIHYFDYKDSPEKLKKYLGAIVSYLLIIGAGVTILFLLFGTTLFHLCFQKNSLLFMPFGLMCVLTAFFNSIFKTYSGLLINQQRTIPFFWTNILYFITSICFTLVGLHLFPGRIDGPLWGRLMSSFVLFVISLIFFMKKYGIKFRTEYISETFKFCKPLLYYSVITWLTLYGDRYIINYFLKSFDVGIFDFGMKWAMLIDIVLLALANSINPAIFNIWTDTKITKSTPEINKNHYFFTLIQMFLVSSSLLFIPLIVPLFIKNDLYYSSFDYLPVLVLGFLFRGATNMYLMPLFYFKKTTVLPKIFLISSVIQIFALVVLIHYFGLMGAAISFVLSKPVQMWFIARESEKIFDFNFNKMKMFYLPVCYGLLIVAIYYYGTNFISIKYLSVLQFIICCLLILGAYRNEISEKFFKR